MQAPPIQPRPLPMVWIVLTSAGVALLAASGFAVLACSAGLLFGGAPSFLVVLQSVPVCVAVTSVMALVLMRTQRHFGWRTLFAQVAVVAFSSVGVLSFLDTHRRLKSLTHPAPVPSRLRVIHGTMGPFVTEVHLIGPTDSIATLLRSKGLFEVPSRPPEDLEVQVSLEPPQDLDLDLEGWKWREQTKVSKGWWNPTAMTRPKFFFLRHQTGATNSGWIEGWWVNGPTNEVYVTQRM